MGGQKQYSYEREALRLFHEVLSELGLEFYSGQSRSNRIELSKRIYYQFGDLRVSSGNRHVVVEVESAGGVTNLAKYWLSLERKLVAGQLGLLHLFLQSSSGDYASHLELWDLLAEQMRAKFPETFFARRYTYHSERLPADLKGAIGDFQAAVAGGSLREILGTPANSGMHPTITESRER